MFCKKIKGISFSGNFTWVLFVCISLFTFIIGFLSKRVVLDMFYFIMGTRNLHGFLFVCLFSLIIGLLGDRVFLETVLMGKGNIKHVI